MPTDQPPTGSVPLLPDNILTRLKAVAAKEYTTDEIAELEARISGARQDPATYAKAQAASKDYNDFDIGPDGKVRIRR